jgi:transcriptional regulator with XRE-family HTH domain
MASRAKQISSEMPHIGSIVKENIEKSRYNQAEIGRFLNISAVGVSRYTAEKSLQCYILWNLSKVFQVNLFEPIGEALALPKPNIISPNELLLQQRVIDLEKELAIYKEIVISR